VFGITLLMIWQKELLFSSINTVSKCVSIRIARRIYKVKKETECIGKQNTATVIAMTAKAMAPMTFTVFCPMIRTEFSIASRSRQMAWMQPCC
jgi:hypothetical protein